MRQTSILRQYRFLLVELVKKGIRLKYRRSYLGILWSLIEPILSTIVLVIVFGTLFNNKNPTYPLYIIIGRLFMSFFQEGSRAAMTSIRRNSSMIKKVYIPKYLYPLSSTIFSYIIFLISTIVIIMVDIFCKVVPTIQVLWLIPALILIFMLTLSCGTILCCMNVFFRDIEYIWNVLCMIIMYMSAVFYYPEKILSSGFAWILNINPVYHIVTLARNAVLSQPVNIHGIFYTCGFIAFFFSLGNLMFYKLKDKFVFSI